MPPKGKGTIFINYRREDSNWNALAIYNELQKYFSRDQLFKDFNAIRPGDDYVKSIGNALQSCDVLLVLIGDKWLNITDEAGNRRLDNPDDFVRLEIAKALSRDIKVVPVMLDEVKMPSANQLPENLQALTRRQLVEIDPTRFEDDVRKLAEAIRNILRDCGYEPNPPGPIPGPPKPYPPQPVDPRGARKPDNNMVLAIASTILCCPPLGIVSIIKANKVEGLYKNGKYEEAAASAKEARQYAIWGICISIAFWILYYILLAAGAVQQPESLY